MLLDLFDLFLQNTVEFVQVVLQGIDDVHRHLLVGAVAEFVPALVEQFGHQGHVLVDVGQDLQKVPDGGKTLLEALLQSDRLLGVVVLFELEDGTDLLAQAFALVLEKAVKIEGKVVRGRGKVVVDQ